MADFFGQIFQKCGKPPIRGEFSLLLLLQVEIVGACRDSIVALTGFWEEISNLSFLGVIKTHIFKENNIHRSIFLTGV